MEENNVLSFCNDEIDFYKDPHQKYFVFRIEVTDFDNSIAIYKELNLNETIKLRDYLNKLIEDENLTQTTILPT